MKTRIRELISGWRMEIVIDNGEEKLQGTPRNQKDIDKNWEWIKENKEEIIAEMKVIEATEKQREENIRNIEGLDEIKKIHNEWANYHYETDRRFETEDYRPVPKPKATVKELKEKYPRAAAYLLADNWSQSNNIGKYSAGKKALERIIAGEDYKKAIEEMEAEWSEYTRARMWD